MKFGDVGEEVDEDEDVKRNIRRQKEGGDALCGWREDEEEGWECDEEEG